MRNEILRYEKTGQLVRTRAGQTLAQAHLARAGKNLEFATLVLERIPEHASWATISSYYAAYHAALAVLARHGYLSKSHTATIAAVKEIGMNINTLEQLKQDRETANYSPESEYVTTLAKHDLNLARDIVFTIKEQLAP